MSSFPEPTWQNGPDMRPMGSRGGKHLKPLTDKERDQHELWVAVRLFIHVYGADECQRIVDDARAHPVT